jgi:hypothetical protein
VEYLKQEFWIQLTNANQDYMRVNYTYGCLHYVLSNRQPIKKCLTFLHGYGPIAIADWSIIVNHCAMPSIGQTWVLASIGAVVEMGVLTRTLKRLLMESIKHHAMDNFFHKQNFPQIFYFFSCRNATKAVVRDSSEWRLVAV